MNTWWIDQFLAKPQGKPSARVGHCDLKQCPACLRVWSRIGMTKNQIYYTRGQVPFYGQPKKQCKECNG